MKCLTQTCVERGFRSCDGLCKRCYHEITHGFDSARREAERLGNVTGKRWLVAELAPDCDAARLALSLGTKAYHVVAARYWDEVFKPIEEYGPQGRIWQSPEAP